MTTGRRNPQIHTITREGEPRRSEEGLLPAFNLGALMFSSSRQDSGNFNCIGSC